MIAPLNLERIQSALAARDGWIEVAAILACFAVGWWLDHRRMMAIDMSRSR